MLSPRKTHHCILNHKTNGCYVLLFDIDLPGWQWHVPPVHMPFPKQSKGQVPPSSFEGAKDCSMFAMTIMSRILWTY